MIFSESRFPLFRIMLEHLTPGDACAMRAPMINFATSYFWYFSYDSSLAGEGSRSI
jgi:hypothetical protein